MDLGADTWQTFRYVTLPVVRTALLAGGLLAFALSFDEVIVTTFTAGTEQTLPIWILANLRLPNQRPLVNVVARGPDRAVGGPGLPRRSGSAATAAGPAGASDRGASRVPTSDGRARRTRTGARARPSVTIAWRPRRSTISASPNAAALASPARAARTRRAMSSSRPDQPGVEPPSIPPWSARSQER